MTKYDSLAEEAFHARNPSLIHHTNNYPCWFKDDTGSTWRAKPDFFDLQSQTFIEFKCHQLNSKLTKLEAEQKLLAAQQFKKQCYLIDKLNNAWNHSYIKQSIVQRTLANDGINMMVVFANKTKLSTQFKNRMKLIGLKWQYETDYFSKSVHKMRNSCT